MAYTTGHGNGPEPIKRRRNPVEMPVEIAHVEMSCVRDVTVFKLDVFPHVEDLELIEPRLEIMGRESAGCGNGQTRVPPGFEASRK
jgi:hypothetical protein